MVGFRSKGHPDRTGIQGSVRNMVCAAFSLTNNEQYLIDELVDAVRDEMNARGMRTSTPVELPSGLTAEQETFDETPLV